MSWEKTPVILVLSDHKASVHPKPNTLITEDAKQQRSFAVSHAMLTPAHQDLTYSKWTASNTFIQHVTQRAVRTHVHVQLELVDISQMEKNMLCASSAVVWQIILKCIQRGLEQLSQLSLICPSGDKPLTNTIVNVQLHGAGQKCNYTNVRSN